MGRIIHGDCVEQMAAMEPDSIDAIVTDPPYVIGFMSKEWDRNHSHEAWAIEALRVAKPGAYLLAFGSTRTVHRLTVALEDAGWVIRDTLCWVYASGFPKSKSTLKPAWEPIVMARKDGPLAPLNIDDCRIGKAEGQGGGAAGTSGFAEGYEKGDGFTPSEQGRWPANVVLTDPVFDGEVQKSGVAVNRNRNGDTDDGVTYGHYPNRPGPDVGYGDEGTYSRYFQLPDGPAVVGGGMTKSGSRTGTHSGSDSWSGEFGPVDKPIAGDEGTYSRFFIIPKASRKDREPAVPGDLEEAVPHTHNADGRDMSKPTNGMGEGERKRIERGEPAQIPRVNTHPTVKPVMLMRHLVRLITPDGGTVLDPFLGSGTTALAAEAEDFEWVGIEREAEYIAIAEQRLVKPGLGL